jgi:hypothetical protein
MYKLLFPLLLLLFLSNAVVAQIKKYKLVSKSDNSDFAMKIIDEALVFQAK